MKEVMPMNCFGVCNYDFDALYPEVVDLKKFDSWEDAYKEYAERMKKYDNYPYSWDNSLWIVWIEDNKLIQFEQLNRKTKCKTVSL